MKEGVIRDGEEKTVKQGGERVKKDGKIEEKEEDYTGRRKEADVRRG